MKFALVTTTINVPYLLDDYCKNFRENGHEDVEVIVIGDRKSPAESDAFCKKIASSHGYNVEFWDVEMQEKWLGRFPALAEHLPWNSIQRRNLGYLLAYERGNDVTISIDDDNYVVESDYLKPFAGLGNGIKGSTVESPTGWYNICEELLTPDKRVFYPRGFAYSKKWSGKEPVFTETEGKLVVQAGLWLGDPDIDAVTRLEKPIDVTGVSEKAMEGIILGRDTYCPFNTQNTAIHTSLTPAWFMSPYVGRFDDIWASYIITRIAHHLGDKVAFGRPIVKQTRNEHILYNDLRIEIFGMENTDMFMDVLRETDLKGSGYFDCYGEIHDSLSSAIGSRDMKDEQAAEAFKKLINGMKIWLDVIGKL